MKILKTRKTDDRGMDGWSVMITARLTDKEKLDPQGAFHDQFCEPRYCGHEHDCCGCVFNCVMAPRHARRSQYNCEIHYYRNC